MQDLRNDKLLRLIEFISILSKSDISMPEFF